MVRQYLRIIDKLMLALDQAHVGIFSVGSHDHTADSLSVQRRRQIRNSFGAALSTSSIWRWSSSSTRMNPQRKLAD
jgi:hypothetical protein